VPVRCSSVFVQYLGAGAARTGDEHTILEHDHLRRELARQARVGDHALPAGEGGCHIGVLAEPGGWDALRLFTR
jgi:hypothetical protein